MSSAADRGDWLTSCPGCLNLRTLLSLGTCREGGYVSWRVDLDTVWLLLPCIHSFRRLSNVGSFTDRQSLVYFTRLVNCYNNTVSARDTWNTNTKHWHANTEVLGEELVSMPLDPPQIPKRQTLDRTSVVRGGQLSSHDTTSLVTLHVYCWLTLYTN